MYLRKALFYAKLLPVSKLCSTGYTFERYIIHKTTGYFGNRLNTLLSCCWRNKENTINTLRFQRLM